MHYFGYEDLAGVYKNPEKAFNPILFEIKLLRKVDKYKNAFIRSSDNRYGNLDAYR